MQDNSHFNDCLTDDENVQNNPDTICKYCLENMESNDLYFNPCKCKMKIHHKCLENWIRYRKTPNCEVCHTNYIITYTHKCSPICCNSNCLNFFYKYKYAFIMFFLTFFVPFFGNNDYHLVEYTYSNEEHSCIYSNYFNIDNTNNKYNFLLLFNILYPMALIIIIFISTFSILAWWFTIRFFFMINNKFTYIIRDNFILSPKFRCFIISLFILLCHLIFHIIGNICFLNSVILTFTDPNCIQFNQLQIDRVIWLSPINISIVSWFCGFGVFNLFLCAIWSIFTVIFCIASICNILYVCCKCCCKCRCFKNFFINCKNCVFFCCCRKKIIIQNFSNSNV